MSAVHYRLPTPTVPGTVTRAGPLVAAVAVVALVATLVVMEPWGPSSSAWATRPTEPMAHVLAPGRHSNDPTPKPPNTGTSDAMKGRDLRSL